MEHNIDVMEGTRFPLCVTLKDGEGNALAADGFRVYGGAVCPGMGAVAFPVTRSGGDFVVMVPGLAVGRMPWRYQVFVVEQATGVEWLLCSGEVRPEARCADASGGVAAGSLTVTGVLDKQTLSLGVQLGESTELCRSLVARAEEAARRAEEAAAGASFTLTAEEVQKVVPIAFDSDAGSARAVAGSGSVVFGGGGYAYGGDCIVIGRAARAGGAGGIALGVSSNSGVGIAIGRSAHSFTKSVVIGEESTSNASGNVVIGSAAKNQYYAQDCVIIGRDAVASEHRTVAIGGGVEARGIYGVAIGDNARVESGADHVAVGKDAKAKGSTGTAVGYAAEVTNNEGTAVGGCARVEGYSGVAVGGRAAAKGACSVAVGANALAKHESAFVLGIGAVSKNDGEMVLKATNVEEGTSVSLSFMAGTATGYNEDMWSPSRFMDDTKVKLTVRDELSGLQHSVAVSLNLLMYHLKAELQAVSEFGVVEGDGYGYGYGYGY